MTHLEGCRFSGASRKEAVPVNRSILSRPWARRTGEHRKGRQPGKGFLLLPVLGATGLSHQHLLRPSLLRSVHVQHRCALDVASGMRFISCTLPHPK